jgi:hypothetical protein
MRVQVKMSEVKNVMKAVWIIYLIDFFGENQFEAWCGYSNWDLGSYGFVTGLADSLHQVSENGHCGSSI